MLKHRGKEKVKIDFSIQVHRVANLPDFNGSTVFLAWRRGSKSKSGTTQCVLVKDGEATFGEEMHFSSTFFKSGNGFDDKNLSITLKEAMAKKGTGRTLGKVRINLCHFANKTVDILPFGFDDCKIRQQPTLYMSFGSIPLKLGNHKVEKVEADEPSKISSGASGSKGGGQMLTEISGELYRMETTSSHSATSVDSASVMSDLEPDREREMLKISEEKDPDANSVAQNLNDEEMESLRTENYEKLKAIQSQQMELMDLRSRLASAEDSVQDLQEENAMLRKALEDAKKELKKYTNTPLQIPDKPASGHAKHDRKHHTTSNSSTRANDSPTPPPIALSADPVKRASQLSSVVEALEQEKQELIFFEKEIYLAATDFKEGVSFASETIYQQLAEWDVFRGNKQNLIDKMVTAVENVCSQCTSSASKLSFWLSSTCSILKNIRQKQQGLNTEDGDSPEAISLNYFDGRLTTLIFKVYSYLVTNLTTEISPNVVSVLLHSGLFDQDTNPRLRRTRGVIPTTELITRPLSIALSALRDNFVPDSLVQQFFTQICYFINAAIFNYIITHKEDCVINRGFQLKMAAAKILDWLTASGLKNATTQFAPILEVSTIFIMDKAILGDAEVLKQVCPSLSYSQVRHLLSMFSPEPPAAVVSKLKGLVAKQGTAPEIELNSGYVQRLSFAFLNEEGGKKKSSKW